MSLQHDFAKLESVTTILFRNTLPPNPLVNVTAINYIREHGVTGVFFDKQFRYSFNNKDFTNWAPLTIFALQGIQLTGTQDLFLEIRYKRTGVGSGSISNLFLLYDSSAGDIDAIPDASIDAYSFQGQLPFYYLNNEFHHVFNNHRISIHYSST